MDSIQRMRQGRLLETAAAMFTLPEENPIKQESCHGNVQQPYLANLGFWFKIYIEGQQGATGAAHNASLIS